MNITNTFKKISSDGRINKKELKELLSSALDVKGVTQSEASELLAIREKHGDLFTSHASEAFDAFLSKMKASWSESDNLHLTGVGSEDVKALLRADPRASLYTGRPLETPSPNNALPFPDQLRTPRLKLPKPGLNASQLIDFVDARVQKMQQKYGEGFEIQPGFLSWAIAVSQNDGADASVKKCIAKHLSTIKNQSGWDELVESVTKAFNEGKTFAKKPGMAITESEKGGPIELTQDELKQTLNNVRDILVEAAGSDQVLESHEVSALGKTLSLAESRIINGVYDALTQRSSSDAIKVSELQALFSEATTDVGKAQTQKLTESAAMQLSVFAGLSFDFARIVHKNGASDEQTLRKLIKNSALERVVLNYKQARDALYSIVDNRNGQVRDVYTDRSADVTNRDEATANNINAEHIRPRSTGVKDTAAESDLHHLFVSDEEANHMRSSWPFGLVEKVEWQNGESKLGFDAKGNMVFEPPKKHRGNIARALFYVSISYGLSLDKTQEALLRKWHVDDPVDDDEALRNDLVETFQNNRNPFIDDPSLVDGISRFY